MKNRSLRNALGGSVTNAPELFYQDTTRFTAEDRLDSNRARIIKYNGSSQATYDIQLLYNSETIKNVASVNIPATPYAIGKEVKITYPHGLRQQPMIDGGIFAGRGDTGSGSSYPPEMQALGMAQQALTLLRNASIILADESLENIYGSDSIDYLLPAAFQHTDAHIELPVRYPVTRITGNFPLTELHENIFADTDGGAFTITLPAGVSGREYKIRNVGRSGNRVTIIPDGAELLFGESSQFLIDGEVLDMVFEPTEGWW